MAGSIWANAKSFTVQLLLGRFFTVFASLMFISFSGTSYLFGLYSNDIKSTLGYDQSTLNLISFFKDLGAYISVHGGLIMEVFPPVVVLFLGVVMNFVGYLMVWLSLAHKVSRPQVWQMCLYMCIGANAFGFTNTAAIVTTVRNFPESRGSVIGILKAYVGLGGAVITQLYHAIYANDPNSIGIILLIAWLPAVPLVLFPYSIRVIKAVNRQAKTDKKFFENILYISLALAAFILVLLIVQKRVEFSKSAYQATTSVIMVVLVLPVLLVVKEEFAAWKTKGDSNVSPISLTEVKIVPQDFTPQPVCPVPGASSEDNITCFQNVFHPPERGQNHTILQATFSLDMIILLLATICGLGGNLTTIDNLGQIGKSLAYPKQSLSTLVSLVSIWQYLGRVMGGLISEFFLTKFRCPRPLVFAIILFISCIGHLLIAFNVPYGLYIASITVGFCFGASWTLIFSIISELFGLKHYATLFNYGTLAVPLASYIFNVRVAGHLYDREGTRQLKVLGLTRMPGQELTCKGAKCYQLAYIIIAAATFFGGLLCLLLTARTRKLYKSDLYKKYQKGEEEQPSVTTTTSAKDLKKASSPIEEEGSQL